MNVAATADRGSEPAEETSAWARSLVMTTTVPRAAVLIRALLASQMPWVPSIRLIPGKGLSFFSVGFMGFPANRTPPWAADDRAPTSIMATAVGSRVLRNAISAWPSRICTFSTSGC